MIDSLVDGRVVLIGVVVSSSILGTFEVVELNRVVNHVDVAVERVG